MDLFQRDEYERLEARVTHLEQLAKARHHPDWFYWGAFAWIVWVTVSVLFR